jgi:hypothetical protein
MQYHYTDGDLSEFIRRAKEPKRVSIDELTTTPPSARSHPSGQPSPFMLSSSPNTNHLDDSFSLDEKPKKPRTYSFVDDYSDVTSPKPIIGSMNDENYDPDLLDKEMYFDLLSRRLVEYVKEGNLEDFLDLLALKGNLLNWKLSFDHIFDTENFRFFEEMKQLSCFKKEFETNPGFKAKVKCMNSKQKQVK